MRRRPAFWILLGLLLLVGGAILLRVTRPDRQLAAISHPPSSSSGGSAVLSSVQGSRFKVQGSRFSPLPLPSSTMEAQSILAEREKKSGKFKNRLANTQKTVGQLAQQDHAILLANALLDTEQPIALNIPEHLRSQGDPGSYIVQSREPLTAAFQAELKQAGAVIVSDIPYIPNNSLLVRAATEVAQQLAASPHIQTVLSYEPYYKLQTGLLNPAVDGERLPDGSVLNVLLFGDATESTTKALKDLGSDIVAQEKSSLGTILKVVPPDDWTAVARLPGVRVVEMSHSRMRANDLSRVTMGVSDDTLTPTNYLGLTGLGVLVNVNDTGVDAGHPDLAPRVFGDLATSLVDSNGHGTHVAGIIIGSGNSSTNPVDVGSFASGSVTNANFRGKAPNAKVFAMSIKSSFGRGDTENSVGNNLVVGSDAYLQEKAAQTNALISNNSWHYFADNDYDLAAASYDAAVRDSLPQQPGSQRVLYVFSAGNSGGGGDDGSGGDLGTIESPGTAKNVITVGAVEQYRNIFDQVTNCVPPAAACTTNTPWFAMTDSSNQIASFSARGNVGVGTEGDFGRFKPDLVAPGTFVVSTTRKDHWDQASYYDPTNYHFSIAEDQTVATNTLQPFSIFVPYNAVQMIISVYSPVALPIYVRQAGLPTTTTYDVRGTNRVSLPPAAPLSPVNANWNYSIGNPTSSNVTFTVVTELLTTNDQGNYLQVLSNMNYNLGPFYRYESGTSMSAADVSGMLALMHEFFQQHHLTNSPALMKALAINGARPVSDRYHPPFYQKLNSAGWGQASLRTSFGTNFNTASGASMFFFDQTQTNTVATGQRRTYNVQVSSDGQNNPLQVTLVWTDPPGDPVAGTKLVNDLDLIVTNLDTGDVFFGNDIPIGGDFNSSWDTNSPPNLDAVNNVESVFLSPQSGTNFSVTVFGKRVNVNAVTSHPNNIVQDFALVISSGNGEVPTALTVQSILQPVSVNVPFVTDITNSFTQDPENFGGFVLNQHVGANPALIGTNTLPLPQYRGQLTIGITNQWHFYTVTNGAGFTNAAFLTFLPPSLSIARMGVRAGDIDNAAPPEADIDIYVSTNPDLTNLVPSVIAAADKSEGRGGTETVVLSNAVAGVYYIGVKSETGEAAEYGFLGVFSLQPFANSDANGNLTLRGFPKNVPIPDGTPATPAGARIFAVCPQPIQVKRVIVTDTITHQNMGDLFGNLNHSLLNVVLNNHSGFGTVTNQAFVYDDSGKKDFANARHTDGPGSLTLYAGGQGAGQWVLTQVDNTPGNIGTNNNLSIFLERQQDPLQGITEILGPGECSDDFVYVPVQATNLTVRATLITPGGPVTMEVCPLGASGADCKSTTLGAVGSTNSIVIDKTSNPPLNEGLYVIHICNNGSGNVTVNFRAFLFLDAAGVIPSLFTSSSQTPINDDAVTYSSLNVSQTATGDPLKIVSAEVGIRIDHPRVSDLVLTLVAPDGTRMLLDENRGAWTTNGMGTNNFSTNIVPVSANGDYHAQTNTINLGVVPTFFQVTWDFFQVPDWMHIYYGGTLIFDTGVSSGTGTFSTNLPGPPTQVTIVMNEGDNTNHLTTAWEYTVTSTAANYIYTWFTEDTNKTITPIKFAIPPFVPTNINDTTALSTFEGSSGDYPQASTVDGWLVTANQVSAINDPSIAAVGNRCLALANGSLSRTLNTVPGRQYRLTYNYRGPGINAWYRGEGNPNDEVNGINGTISPPVSYPAGRVGAAFSFNGSSANAVNLPDSPLLAFTQSFSLEGWFYVTNPVVSGNPPAQMLIFRGDYRGGLDPYFLDVEARAGFPNGCLQFGIEDNAGGSAFITSQTPITNWTHFAATLDNVTGVMSLYTNGVLANQTTTGIRPLGPLDPNSLPGVGIGNHSSQPNPIWRYPFTGRIDECSFYQRALTPSEVQAIWQLGTIGKFEPTTAAPTNLAKMRISVDGVTNIVYGQNTNWTTGTMIFTATQSTTPVLVDGLEPGMLIDEFDLNESSVTPAYYLPEDPYGLSRAKGKSAIGNWKLELWDNRVGPFPTNPPPELLSWQLSCVFATARSVPISLIHNETVSNTIAAGQFQYYSIRVPSWASFATNILFSANPTVNVWFNPSIPPTGTNVGDIRFAAGVNNSVTTIVTNGAPPLVRGSTYYIGIENPGPTSATVSFQVDFDVTPLTNAIAVTSPSDPNAVPRFFSYNVTNGETGIAVLLTNISDNVDLVIRKTPFPDLFTYDYGSFNPGTNDESVLIYTNSDPVPLSPGNWYFGVFNRTATNANYTIVVVDVPYIITLYNATPYANTNNGGVNNIDYYRFRVSTNSVRAQFEINNPSGDMTLVARKGFPPANLTNYNYISANPGNSDELITVFDFSTPIPLTPGDWFISAVNVSGGSVTYSAMATEWPFYGTNIVITNVFMSSSNSFCMTWTSLPGVHYYVQGITNIFNPNWTNVSPTVTAPDYSTTWCLALPSQYQFFRVHEGLAPGPPAAPFSLIGSGKSASANQLNWSGPPGAEYQVEWTDSLTQPVWHRFDKVVTSDTGEFSFVDDTAGPGARRYYRAIQLEKP